MSSNVQMENKKYVFECVKCISDTNDIIIYENIFLDDTDLSKEISNLVELFNLI